MRFSCTFPFRPQVAGLVQAVPELGDLDLALAGLDLAMAGPDLELAELDPEPAVLELAGLGSGLCALAETDPKHVV